MLVVDMLCTLEVSNLCSMSFFLIEMLSVCALGNGVVMDSVEGTEIHLTCFCKIQRISTALHVCVCVCVCDSSFPYIMGTKAYKSYYSK